MTSGVVNVAPRHTAHAWDMVEELTFARTAKVPRPTISAIAREVGISGPAVRAWEDGEYMPGLAAFVAWADALGYDVVLQSREDG